MRLPHISDMYSTDLQGALTKRVTYVAANHEISEQGKFTCIAQGNSVFYVRQRIQKAASDDELESDVELETAKPSLWE